MTTYDEYCTLCNDIIALLYYKNPTIELTEILNPVDIYQITMLWRSSMYSMLNTMFYNYMCGQVTAEYFDKFLSDLKIKLTEKKI